MRDGRARALLRAARERRRECRAASSRQKEALASREEGGGGNLPGLGGQVFSCHARHTVRQPIWSHSSRGAAPCEAFIFLTSRAQGDAPVSGQKEALASGEGGGGGELARARGLISLIRFYCHLVGHLAELGVPGLFGSETPRLRIKQDPCQTQHRQPIHVGTEGDDSDKRSRSWTPPHFAQDSFARMRRENASGPGRSRAASRPRKRIAWAVQMS